MPFQSIPERELAQYKKFYQECPRATDKEIFDIMVDLFGKTERTWRRYKKQYKWVNKYREKLRKDPKLKSKLKGYEIPKLEDVFPSQKQGNTSKAAEVLPTETIPSTKKKDEVLYEQRLNQVIDLIVTGLSPYQIKVQLKNIVIKGDKDKKKTIWHGVDIVGSDQIDNLIKDARHSLVSGKYIDLGLEAAIMNKRLDQVYVRALSDGNLSVATRIIKERARLMYLTYGTLDPDTVFEDMEKLELSEADMIKYIKGLKDEIEKGGFALND